MVPGAQEDAGDRCNAQSLEQGLVVRHDDRSLPLAEIEKDVIGGPGGLEGPVPRRETQRGLGVAIALSQELEFCQDGSRDDDIWSPEEALEFRLEIHPELEGHEKGVCVEQDELGHGFRTLKASYMGMR
jgi:hypothetical protein